MACGDPPCSYSHEHWHRFGGMPTWTDPGTEIQRLWMQQEQEAAARKRAKLEAAKHVADASSSTPPLFDADVERIARRVVEIVTELLRQERR